MSYGGRRSPLKSSRYNFWVPLDEGGILYNARSGVAMRFSGGDAVALSRLLSCGPREIDRELIASELCARLRKGKFLIEADEDELEAVRQRYWEARGHTPMVLTLTTTQDCNLGCYYCYETRSRDSLESTHLAEIISWVDDKLRTSGKDSIHVDWYGGEPLLNPGFIEQASAELQRLSAGLGVSYSASVISNGTRWPTDATDFVRRNKIRQVQISFDGMKANHDKRRRFRKGHRLAGENSSFDIAIDLVDNLLEAVRVDVRFNVDRGNSSDLESFIALCIDRGWFKKPFPCIFQLARISNYSERVGFMRNTQIGEDAFEILRERARALIPAEADLDETTSRMTYPLPRTSVCAALATDSVVIGANGDHYRCGLQVGEENRAVLISRPGSHPERGPDFNWWEAFDPTRQPSCSICSFLPVCWGGCPKKHLEGDKASLHEQSLFWRKALPQKIASQFGVVLGARDFVFGEHDQFRLPAEEQN